MMLFYWLASLTGARGRPARRPRERVDDHIVYAAPPFGLGAFGAGRILGVDGDADITAHARA